MCSVSTPSAPPPPTPIAPTDYTSGIEFGGVSMRSRQQGRKRDILRAGGLSQKEPPVISKPPKARLGGVAGLTLNTIRSVVDRNLSSSNRTGTTTNRGGQVRSQGGKQRRTTRRGGRGVQQRRSTPAPYKIG